MPSGQGLFSHRLFRRGHLPPKCQHTSTQTGNCQDGKCTSARHRNQPTFTLAGRRPQVSRGHEAEAGRAVCGHRGLIQGDDLVAKAQRAVQTRTQLLHHPQDPNSRHLLDHHCRGVQLTEDNLKGKYRQPKDSAKGIYTEMCSLVILNQEQY